MNIEFRRQSEKGVVSWLDQHFPPSTPAWFWDLTMTKTKTKTKTKRLPEKTNCNDMTFSRAVHQNATMLNILYSNQLKKITTIPLSPEYDLAQWFPMSSSGTKRFPFTFHIHPATCCHIKSSLAQIVFWKNNSGWSRVMMKSCLVSRFCQDRPRSRF